MYRDTVIQAYRTSLIITDISANVTNFSTDINASVMDSTDVLMLKIWPILADTDIDFK